MHCLRWEESIEEICEHAGMIHAMNRNSRMPAYFTFAQILYT